MTYDPKAQLVAFLSDNVCEAYGGVPANRPAEFLTVELVGETGTRYLSRPQFAVQAWAATDAEASALSLRAVEAMRGFAYEPHVRRCELNSRCELFDPYTRTPRYQMVFDLVVQG